MRFVGVDLAWGERNRTGVARLDGDGVLLDVVSVRTDAEVVDAAALGPDEACVVGIDAPLVVTNPTGTRGAETSLNRDFRAFEAGAHPSNTGLAVFADGPRGGRVADALGLTPWPAPPSTVHPGPPGRRAVEVYPHAASVALFRLGRTLKYKQKQGRELPQLRSELLRLTTLLEGLATADVPLRLAGREPWEGLVAAVERAPRKSDLRLAEDQVDAVLCAYVALLVDRAPGTLTQYGDPAQGTVVTPTLPTDLEPDRAPRGSRRNSRR
ncbi:DUF429 domain-containing protein [uncultured Nocardioides sp.]|uniref:DUF429 domain-containing protein n=1 Tax=uncultured Nocardioides sp. TaxID=198441 RepID=UPI00260C474B|nr:DUF429 domain-containing protein [uncultured Nocardioides sp.]